MHDTERNSPFIEFYMRYGRLVRVIVGVTAPEEEVIDIAASVWAHVQSKWPFRGIRNIEAYLTRAAQNEVKMFYRNRDAKKRPPHNRRVDFADEDGPSGVDVDNGLLAAASGVSKAVDDKRLKENLLELGEELSGAKGELMERFLEHPSGVSPNEFRRLAASAKKHVKRLGADVDPLKEGPSFVGHVAAKIRRKKNREE